MRIEILRPAKGFASTGAVAFAFEGLAVNLVSGGCVERGFGDVVPGRRSRVGRSSNRQFESVGVARISLEQALENHETVQGLLQCDVRSAEPELEIVATGVLWRSEFVSCFEGLQRRGELIGSVKTDAEKEV